MTRQAVKRAAAIFAIVATALLAARSAARADDIPRDPQAFTQYVAASFAKALPGTKIVTEGPLRLSLWPRGDRHVAYLDTIYEFCQHSREHCAEAVGRHVGQIVASYRDEVAPPSRAALRAVLRPAAYVDELRKSLGDRGEPLVAPFLAGLWIIDMFDLPTAMKTVAPSDVEKLGLSRDEAMMSAKINVGLALRPLKSVLQDIPNGGIGIIRGDPCESSRLLFPETWRAAFPGVQGVLVAAPGADTVLWTMPKDQGSVDDLRNAVKSAMGSGMVFRPLSTAIFRLTTDGWEVASGPQ